MGLLEKCLLPVHGGERGLGTGEPGTGERGLGTGELGTGEPGTGDTDSGLDQNPGNLDPPVGTGIVTSNGSLTGEYVGETGQ